MEQHFQILFSASKNIFSFMFQRPINNIDKYWEKNKSPIPWISSIYWMYVSCMSVYEIQYAHNFVQLILKIKFNDKIDIYGRKIMLMCCVLCLHLTSIIDLWYVRSAKNELQKCFTTRACCFAVHMICWLSFVVFILGTERRFKKKQKKDAFLRKQQSNE